MKLYRKTKRVVVRPLELSDYETWKSSHLEMLSPQNTWDLTAKTEKELTRAQYKKLLAGRAKFRKKDYFYDMGIFNLRGDLVGTVSIMEVTRGISHTAYLGYRIFNKYWGKGYGTDAAKAMIDIGFKEIKLHRIEAGIEPKNKRSIRLARTLGMRKEGLKKRAIYLRGQWVDLLMFTLTTEDVGIKFNPKTPLLKPR
ncbi:MAG: N-acetyltransferase [Pseudobdellovibrio sp.]|jgi:ribosomal-protein-alanine N-acetyltransferase|nr:N-acetyltransferase [Pseudobdellovibrio sp.]